MFKKTAILGLFLALMIPVGCSQNNRQADLDDQIEAQLNKQNIKNVDADVKNDGRIELTGNVDTEQQKLQAEQTARNISGSGHRVENLIKVTNTETPIVGDNPARPDRDVADNDNIDKDVNNNKDVDKDHANVPNDTWLTFKTKLALYADSRVSGTAINVESNKGVVNLIGKVPSQEAKAAAVQVSGKVEGVQKVNDQLQVVPASQHKVVDDTDDNITKNVKDVLGKNSVTKHADLSVVANNGVVSLTGEADNMKQVEVAINDALKVKGVKAVNADAVVVKNNTADHKTAK